MGLCRRIISAWDTVQIELKGTYTPDSVLALYDYTNSTPWWRIVAVVLLTPLPCLAYICLPETVNLSPPSLGMGSNKTFFGRFFLSYTMWCLLQMHMIGERMPLLSLSKKQLVVSAVIVAVLSTGVELLYSWWIGFPVPYTIHMMAVPYVSLMFFALAIVWYPHVRQDWSLLWKIADAILICVCHGLVIIGYPLFYYAFQTMDAGVKRTAFSMVLPILKTIYRALFYYLCRSASGERITIVVVFNADLVNALFVNFCMQYQPSFMTTGGLMVANASQVILMIHDIDVIRKQIAHTARKIIQLTHNEKNTSSLLGDRVATLSMLPRAADIFQRYSFQTTKADAKQSQQTSILNKHSITVVPFDNSTSPFGPSTDIVIGTPSELEQLERKYASLVRKLMYASEFSILTAYAEVITPVVYSLYLFTVFHMPNRDYYSQIASMDSIHLTKTVVNVLLYSLVELTAFTVLTLTLKRRLNFSTMHQLVFVLDRQMIHVQTAIILWVFYTTQISLKHYGTDYSFEFAWLQSNSTTV
ncbi:hypothetical protein PC129_g3992 [Phytophthora cactorum]|uniref:Uncharacterized protein n=1 Tax=Phytophthora cactorum TaxID=29920 RepID=A0A329SR60_9STRA|nr:hypothetical protein GQ600_17882 [Phytophthora cactorum]KAG2789285.1 hypothetical protein Pcac1_g1635 [Phytophthora cactorum]KAG2837888.1 hypothetical protein PC111_g4445 [Phytophthora cactorum]KAG2847316.1 hypothetical protein PC112_g1153 [Phytophthora cactorum]KAG2863163.1 hypothetical protein PC113_g5685 [Phytophthora cactorum]